MLLLIWNDSRRMLTTKWIALILLVFSYASGTGLSLAKAYRMSSLEFGLYILSNHYYLLYFFLISYLALIIRGIRQLQPHELIRFQKREKFMLFKTLSVFTFTSILVFIHWIIALVVGLISLPAKLGFSATPISGIDSDTLMLFFKFKEVFPSPFIATLAIYLYLIIGLTTLAMIIWAISLKFSAKIAIIAVVAIIVNVLVGFKIQLADVFFPLFINKYLILHHVQFQHGWFGLGSLILIQGIVIILIIKKHRKFSRSIYLFDRFINNRRNYSIIFIFLILFILLRLISYTASGVDGSWLDFFTSLYLGIPDGGSNMKEFLSYIIYMGVPIYFIAKFEEFTISYQSVPLMIRHLNKRECSFGILRAGSKFIIVYFVIGLVVSLFISLTIRGTSNGELLNDLGIQGQNLLPLLVVSQFFRILELFMVFGIFRFFMKLAGNTIVAFMFSLIGYFALYMSVKMFKYYPFGISSIIRLSTIYNNGLYEILILILIYAFIVVLIHIFNVKKIGGKILWKK